MNKKLRGGMVGGGIGAFIGPVHRMAAIMDGKAEIVAGAFSSNPEKSKKSGEELFLDPSRVYDSWMEMVEAESKLPAEKRIDFVSIVTPNSSHLSIAKAFLSAGFHVICDKPMTTTLAEAKELREIVQKSNKVFALTHNYTGYPMVKQAKAMIENGELGKINKVVVEYPQGWLLSAVQNNPSAINMWRTNPGMAGKSCCMADIGIHAENLARYITGLQIDELCADLSSFIEGNRLDDDGNVLIHYKGGARGILYASQISIGEENSLKIRVYGEKLGLEWNQENPNYLILKNPEGFKTILSKGNANLHLTAKSAGRLPPGHPDGFIEAFANIYREAFSAILKQSQAPAPFDFPNVDDGVIGLAFIETVLESSKKRSWIKMKE